MTIFKILIAILIPVFASGCIMLREEEWSRLQQDIGDLKREAEDAKRNKEALRLQVDNTRAQVQEIQKMAGVELSTKIAAAEKDLRTNQADLVADITTIRSEFQVLTGRFEELRFASRKSEQDSKNLKDEVYLLLKDTGQKLDELQKRVASLEQSITVLRQGTTTQATEKTSEAGGFEEAYKDAYETYQKGEYQGAREKFQKYMERYPGSKYEENALYWIGEAYYSEKNYEKAIVTFDDVIRRYPDGAKTSASLLKQGMAFSALGDKKNAAAIYKKLVDKYPKSEQAETARKKLKE